MTHMVIIFSQVHLVEIIRNRGATLFFTCYITMITCVAELEVFKLLSAGLRQEELNRLER